MSSPIVIFIDEKSCTVDGVRYIRSWKGRKPSKLPHERKHTPRTCRKLYMKQYRIAKKAELARLRLIEATVTSSS